METFGKYVLLEKIDSGGMAEVFLARSFGADGLGRFVAIKRILPEFCKSKRFTSMFKEEAKIAMNLNHSNVVSIFDYGVEDDQPFLVMEFVEGYNLRRILEYLSDDNEKLSFAQMAFIGKEAAAGIEHAHQSVDMGTNKPLNICHRDVSPQNIMISFEGDVKVLDFGVAKAESQLDKTAAGILKGKYAYMSPEQLEGKADSRSDIFSLGIVLWELVTGERLFLGNDELETMARIRDIEVAPPIEKNPDVPVGFSEIIMKALQKDRAQRYQNMGALINDLNLFLNTEYPKFTKQEFSKFLKVFFELTYKDNRQRLAEYSRITQAPDFVASDDQSTSQWMDPSDSASEITPPPVPRFKNDQSLDGIQQQYVWGNTSSRTKSWAGTVSQTPRRRTSRRRKNSSSPLPLLLMAVLLALVVWWGKKKNIKISQIFKPDKLVALWTPAQKKIEQIREKKWPELCRGLTSAEAWIKPTRDFENRIESCHLDLYKTCLKKMPTVVPLGQLQDDFSPLRTWRSLRQNPPNWASESRAYVLAKQLFDKGIRTEVLVIEAPVMAVLGARANTYYTFETHTVVAAIVSDRGNIFEVALDPQFFDRPIKLPDYLKSLTGSSDCRTIEEGKKREWYQCRFRRLEPVRHFDLLPQRNLAALSPKERLEDIDPCGWSLLAQKKSRAEAAPIFDAAISFKRRGQSLMTYRRNRITNLMDRLRDAPSSVLHEYR